MQTNSTTAWKFLLAQLSAWWHCFYMGALLEHLSVTCWTFLLSCRRGFRSINLSQSWDNKCKSPKIQKISYKGATAPNRVQRRRNINIPSSLAFSQFFGCGGWLILRLAGGAVRAHTFSHRRSCRKPRMFVCERDLNLTQTSPACSHQASLGEG